MPSYAVRPLVPTLRRNHPLIASGPPLVALFPMGVGSLQVHDLMRNPWSPYFSSIATPAVSPWGGAIKYAGFPSWHINETLILPTTACTVLLVLTMPTPNQNGSAFGPPASTTAAWRLQAHMPHTSTIYWDFGGDGGNNRISWSPPSPSTFFTANNWHLIALRAGTQGSSIWCDGERKTGHTNAITRSNASLAAGMTVGAYTSSWNGDNAIDSFHLFARELTDGEILGWMDDPYAHVRPRRLVTMSLGESAPTAIHHAGGVLVGGPVHYAF